MIYITCTMAAWDFADIYTRSPRATGPRAAGVYVSKIPSSHGITITYVMHKHNGRSNMKSIPPVLKQIRKYLDLIKFLIMMGLSILSSYMNSFHLGMVVLLRNCKLLSKQALLI